MDRSTEPGEEQASPVLPFGASATTASGWSASAGPGAPQPGRRMRPRRQTVTLIFVMALLAAFGLTMTVLYVSASDDLEYQIERTDYYQEQYWNCDD
ncbi:hypothetical protein [Actinoplanes regularis]|uniref:Uncharacterized protein n=1 Tax=Actinoplanes regularis TaxID=52697 RepID=A0A239JSN5_9ACTN|nr:hypothetical protein [Actinoplanes regularis]SNT08458.1 hypothetical protein SAMN06264365_13738 [Actinoplanes regularis]